MELEQYTPPGFKSGEFEVVLGSNLKYKITSSRKVILRVGGGMYTSPMKAHVVTIEVQP